MNANIGLNAQQEAPEAGVRPYQALVLQLGPIFRPETVPARIYPVEQELRLKLADRNRLPNMLEQQRRRDDNEAQRRQRIDQPADGVR